jgi:hypothetical protein
VSAGAAISTKMRSLEHGLIDRGSGSGGVVKAGWHRASPLVGKLLLRPIIRKLLVVILATFSEHLARAFQLLFASAKRLSQLAVRFR